jgi:DHA2 family multidrug resistance protein
MTKLFIFDPPYIREQKRKIDYWGLGMLTVGIGALQYVLDKGQQDDWFSSRSILTLSILSGVALATLIVQQLRSKNPLVDLRLFKDRSYAVGVFLMTVLGFVLYGSLVLLPIMLQTLFGYPSLQAGQAMVPRGIGSLIMMPVVGILTGKLDARKLLAVGLTVGGGTLLWMGQLNLQAGYWDLFWPQFIQGAGMALLFVPLTTVSMATISPERMGYATSLFNLMRNIGGSVGIAVTGTILQRQRQTTATLLGEHISIYDNTTQSLLSQITNGFIAAGSDAVTAASRAYEVLHGMLFREASMVAFVMLFRLLGVIFLVMTPLVLIMRRPKGGAAVMAE